MAEDARCSRVTRPPEETLTASRAGRTGKQAVNGELMRPGAARGGGPRLDRADAGSRAVMALSLQRSAGNRATERWLTSTPLTPVVQRSGCCSACASGEGSCEAGAPRQEEPGEEAQEPAEASHAWVPVPVQRGMLDDATAAAQGLLSGLRKKAASVVAGIKSAASSAWGSMQAVGRGLLGRLQHGADAALGGLQSVWSGLQQQATSLWGRLSQLADGAGRQLRKGLDGLLDGLGNAWDGLKNKAGAFWGSIKAAGAAALRALKSMGRSVFGSMHSTSPCVTDEKVAAAKGAFDAESASAQGRVADSAATGLSGLEAKFASSRSGGADALADLDASAAGASTGVKTAVDTGAAAAGTGQARLEGSMADAIGGLQGLATGGIGDLQGKSESGVAGLESQAGQGLGGLRGMIGSLLSAVAGEANAIEGGARQQTQASTGDLRSRGSSLLDQVRGTFESLVNRLRSVGRELLDKGKTLAAEIGRRGSEVLARLQQVWNGLRAQGRAGLDRLRQRWAGLRDKAGGVWRSLLGFLDRMQGRAGTALDTAQGDSCQFDAAKQEGTALNATEIQLPAISFKGKPGGPRMPSDLLAVQSELVEAGGEPLDGSVRHRMEGGFGASIPAVRVHTGSTASRLSGGMNARAFTLGNNIAFGAGEFRPNTVYGDALIAHEVAHVLQQRSTGEPGRDAAPAAAEGAAAEHEADHSAMAVVSRLWLGAGNVASGIAANAIPRLRSGLALRRCSKCCAKPAPSGPLAVEEPDFNCETPRPTDLLTGRRGDKEGGDVYGLTGPGWSSQLLAMINAKSSVNDKCGQTCKPNLSTYPAFSLSPYFFVAAGRYEDFDFNENTGQPGARRFGVAKTGPCKGKSRPRVTIVTPGLAEKVRQAEAEHCKDLKAAWKLSASKYIAAVRELDGGFCIDGDEKQTDGKCTDEFRTRVGARSGIAWAAWAGFHQCLTNLSKDRDDKKWHTVSDKFGTKVGTKDCKEVEVTPDAAQLTNVGNHSPDEVVDSHAGECKA